MLYLKNSLVILTIILFSLFFLTILSADDSNFIFPKKKIISVKSNEKIQDNVEVIKKFKSINLPKKKPLRTNLIQQKKPEDKDKVIIFKPTQKKEAINSTPTIAANLPKKKTYLTK